MKTVVTQRAEFSCGYVSYFENSQLEFHWYNYKVEATISGNQYLKDDGVILEFSEFKKILNNILPNNCFLISNDSYHRFDADKESYDSVISFTHEDAYDKASKHIYDVFHRFDIPTAVVPINLSAESLVNYIAEKLQSQFNFAKPGIIVENVKLRESANSFVEWCKND